MTTSNNDKKVLNVPPLRFPEFKGEWVLTSLSELCGPFEYGLNEPAVSFDGLHKYLRITDIDESTSTFKEDGITSPAGFDDLYKVKENDIVFARTGASVGKTYLYDKKDGCLYYAGFLIRANIRKGNPYFVFSETKRNKFKKWVKLMSARSGQPGINSKEYASYSFFAPSQKEQDKISLVLKLVDQRIDVQMKIIKEKEQLKKWVNNACLWNKDFPKVALNKIIKERNLRTTTVHQYQVLSSAVTGLYSQMDYFKHQISSENDVGYKVVFLNDVVFSPQNLWMGNINFNESFEIGMVSPSYKVYSVNDGFVPSYLSLFLKTNRMKYEYSICSEQGASIVRRNLNEDEFLQITIPMPDFKTQVTVAKKLKLIEQNVETEKQYLELLIKEKSFLLSSLFI